MAVTEINSSALIAHLRQTAQSTSSEIRDTLALTSSGQLLIWGDGALFCAFIDAPAVFYRLVDADRTLRGEMTRLSVGGVDDSWVLLSNAQGLYALELPPRYRLHAEAKGTEIAGMSDFPARFQSLAAGVYASAPEATLVDVRWHPFSHAHAVALFAGAPALCLFSVYGAPPVRYALGALAADAPRAFCFGSPLGWDALVVYLVAASGAVHSLSPVLPSQCFLPRPLYSELMADARARVARLSHAIGLGGAALRSAETTLAWLNAFSVDTHLDSSSLVRLTLRSAQTAGARRPVLSPAFRLAPAVQPCPTAATNPTSMVRLCGEPSVLAVAYASGAVDLLLVDDSNPLLPSWAPAAGGPSGGGDDDDDADGPVLTSAAATVELTLVERIDLALRARGPVLLRCEAAYPEHLYCLHGDGADRALLMWIRSAIAFVAGAVTVAPAALTEPTASRLQALHVASAGPPCGLVVSTAPTQGHLLLLLGAGYAVDARPLASLDASPVIGRKPDSEPAAATAAAAAAAPAGGAASNGAILLQRIDALKAQFPHLATPVPQSLAGLSSVEAVLAWCKQTLAASADSVQGLGAALAAAGTALADCAGDQVALQSRLVSEAKAVAARADAIAADVSALAAFHSNLGGWLQVCLQLLAQQRVRGTELSPAETAFQGRLTAVADALPALRQRLAAVKGKVAATAVQGRVQSALEAVLAGAKAAVGALQEGSPSDKLVGLRARLLETWAAAEGVLDGHRALMALARSASDTERAEATTALLAAAEGDGEVADALRGGLKRGAALLANRWASALGGLVLTLKALGSGVREAHLADLARCGPGRLRGAVAALGDAAAAAETARSLLAGGQNAGRGLEAASEVGAGLRELSDIVGRLVEAVEADESGE